MAKISREQIDQLKEMIVDHIKDKVYGRFDAYIDIWRDYDGHYNDDFEKYVRLSEMYNGYAYRGCINIRNVYIDLRFNKTMSIQEFVSMFDVLWIKCALSIIRKELGKSDYEEELAY